MSAHSLAPFYVGPSRRPTPVLYKPLVRPTLHQTTAINTTPTTYAMVHSTPVPQLSNFQPYHTLPAASSGFGSVSSDDSQYSNTLPSAVIGDFAVSDFHPWRESTFDQPSASADERSATHLGNAVLSRAHSDPGDFHPRKSLLELPQHSVVKHTAYSARSPTLLAGPVDTSDFEHVEDLHWALSVTEYDDEAVSPTTAATHSSGPRTPASPQHGEDVYGERGCNAVAKTETIFESFPSTTLAPAWLPTAFPTPMPAYGHGHPLQNSASFGNMTLSGAFSQPVMWPATGGTSHGAYHAHTHGLPTVAPGLVANHELYHGVHPSAVQPVFPTEPDTFEDLRVVSAEASPEVHSESGSEVDIDENRDEDMNDRALHHAQARRDRDKYLLKMRNEGFSYKEIKRRGNFREAESTLRGRVRVLTKDKADRVRRPEWTPEDLQLLDRAVARFSASHGREGGRGRLPWKKVADYLVQHGSSYHFAAATCARKWKEIE